MATLYLVGTPIGNLEDITYRAVRILRECDWIIAEDTRVTSILLQHIGIRKKMISCHRHNEDMNAESVIRQISTDDANVALVTDAGTPCISDPGNLIVAEALKSGIRVIPIPGPSAVVTGLSVTGFDAREFSFFGFLPRSKGEIRKKLNSMKYVRGVVIFFESPHRVIQLIEVLSEVYPDKQICVCCDLTKIYERSLYGIPRSVLEELRSNPKAEKGEYCIFVNIGYSNDPDNVSDLKVNLQEEIVRRIITGQKPADVIDELTKSGFRGNEIKRAYLNIKRAAGILFEQNEIR